MLPAELDPGTKSPGEREIYKRLRDDPATADWIVLHSLDVSHHVRAVQGELDFLVLIPGKGALALEIKACRHLRRAEGRWYYGEQDEPDSRGPFKQAAEAMHSVRSVVDRHPDLKRVPFWSAVIFPYIRFRERSDEWHEWQVIDNQAFASRPLSELLEGVLANARRFLGSRQGARWFDSEAPDPTPRQCAVIAQMLRPDFDIVAKPGDVRRRRESELTAYTEEQFAALDAMEANPRVAFEGPAGTGKTYLGLEAVRRAAATDKRVLLLCFNAMLGEWLREQIRYLEPHVTAKTIHSYMLQVADTRVPREPGADFWESQLPELALERIIEDPDFSAYDELVVDEAQDILRAEYLDVLDISLRGGLAAGTWKLFGDFERQAIFDSANLTLQEFCETRGGSPTKFRLGVNCRNTPRIVEMVKLLGGLDSGYSRVLRPDTGVEPRVRVYTSSASQCGLLGDTLREFYDDGLSGRDIVVLSPRATSSCAQAVDALPWVDRLAPARGAAADDIPYTTIHAFKGLEAAAVVVTDIVATAGAAMQSLFYTAITRATDRLVILVNEDAGAGLRALLEVRPLPDND